MFCFVKVFRINLFRGELSCRGYCNGKVGRSRGIANNHGRMIYECRENLPTDLLARQVTGNRRCEYFFPVSISRLENAATKPDILQSQT